MSQVMVEAERLKVSEKCLMQALYDADFEQEFELAFQPLFAACSQQLHAVEVLLRWHSPQFGQVPTNEFILLAERYGYIHHITHWVMYKAIQCQARWRAIGIELNIAVNISALDLERPYFLNELQAAIEGRHTLPASITLEVTETAPVRHPALAARQVTALVQAGFRVALDDFGSGHTGLLQLGNLPVNELKIDKSLVQEIEHKASWQRILRSVIDLAHSMGLCVVAEGVENASAQRFLQDVGCDYLQGFYFSKPLSEVELLEWLQRRV